MNGKKLRQCKTLMCDHCKRVWRESAVRICNHPAVVKKYGKNICYSCCIKCSHHTETPPGIGCDLFEKKRG